MRLGRRALFKNRAAQPFDLGGQTAQIVQRVDVKGIAIAQSLEIAARAQEAAQFLGRQVIEVIVQLSRHLVAGGFQPRVIMAADRENPGHGRHARHGQGCDGLTDMLHPLDRKIPEPAGAFGPGMAGDRVIPRRIAGPHKAAITPRGAKAHLMRLDHRHGLTGPRQLQRGGQPRKPAADDQRACLVPPEKRRTRPRLGQALAVIGLRIIHLSPSQGPGPPVRRPKAVHGAINPRCSPCHTIWWSGWPKCHRISSRPEPRPPWRSIPGRSFRRSPPGARGKHIRPP